MSKSIRFSKMHGLGNDFMVIDAVNQAFIPDAEQIQRWANRHTGVGFDQLLLVEPADHPDAEFRYRIFNADGSEVGQCGNGARCFAVFVRDLGLTRQQQIRVQTQSRLLTLTIEADRQVTVDMGVPKLEPSDIPLAMPQRQTLYTVTTPQGVHSFGAVSLGNPHAVLTVTDCRQAPVHELGAYLESHALFPERANIGFMQILCPDAIRLRVYERGSGETQACGSGACAAVVVGRIQNQLDARVNVELPGGSLTIQWTGPDQPVLMTGPAQTVYTGNISLT
ncbi:MAG: diaminopimelate epimerase [Methylococcales bacterium]|nr:diaminopimelate epimerase [Methylococcales bacterium]